MVFRVDTIMGDFRRYVYLKAWDHSDAQKQTREKLVELFKLAPSDITILDIVSEIEKPHILRGEIRVGNEISGYDYDPIFLTQPALFHRERTNVEDAQR